MASEGQNHFQPGNPSIPNRQSHAQDHTELDRLLAFVLCCRVGHWKFDFRKLNCKIYSAMWKLWGKLSPDFIDLTKHEDDVLL